VCRYTFLKSADGCPHCGPNASTSLLLNDKSSIPDNAEIISEATYDFDAGEFL
jgi:hypothetical protein